MGYIAMERWTASRFEHLWKIEDAPTNHGSVLLMRDSETDSLVAVKQMPLWWLLGENALEDSEQPRMDVCVSSLLNQINFRWACRLHGIYYDEEFAYMVMSFASGGDLFSWCQKSYTEPGFKREALIRPIMLQIFHAVRQLHDLSIVHRDLSAENILISADALSDAQVCIIDFGRATTSRLSNVRLGKLPYLAPEIHTSSKHDAFLTDTFALGVVLFALLTKGLPWKSTQPGICKQFLHVKKYGLSSYLSKRRLPDGKILLVDIISEPCIRLLVGLLAVDPRQRLTLGETAWAGWNRRSIWSEEWIAHGL